MSQTKHFLAPPLDALKDMALGAVDEWGAAKMARPAPGMDAYKLSEARHVEVGGTSRLIEAEAAALGITSDAQAARVIAAAGATMGAEIERVEAKAEIRAADTHAAVLAILKTRGIKLHTGPALGR